MVLPEILVGIRELRSVERKRLREGTEERGGEERWEWVREGRERGESIEKGKEEKVTVSHCGEDAMARGLGPSPRRRQMHDQA